MASNDNPNLFGEDTDSSSDESVGASAANKSTTGTDGDGDRKEDQAASGSGGDDGAKKKDDDAEEKAGDGDGDGDDDDDDEKEDKDTAAALSKNNNSKNNNSALFGDDDDSSEDDEFDGNDGIVGRERGEDANSGPAPVGRSMNEKLGLDSDSDDDKDGAKSGAGAKEEEEEKVYVPPRKMELLNLSTAPDAENDNNKSDGDAAQKPTYYITKLPNLVGINSTAYNPETHDAEREEERYRGYVHNMIRWRYKTRADGSGEYERDSRGEPVRESNSRLVKWSDGSFTLHVGTEVLEVDNLDSSVPKDHPDEGMAGFAGINGYLYVSQRARIRPPTKRELEGPPKSDDDDMGDDDNEESPARPAGTVLECIAPITSRLAPRPSSLSSDAHRNLTLAVRQRNVKRARIAEIVTEVDPEKEKQARIKGKEDLAKSNKRSSGGRRGGGGGRRRGMTERYLEEDEGYEGVRLNVLKRRAYMYNSDDEENEEEVDYGDESEDEEDNWTSRKIKKRGAEAARAAAKEKKTAASKDEDDESSEEGEVVFGDDDDDDEEDTAFVKKRGGGGGGAKKAVFGDDDDDD
mmetsp:Transcript_9671/g.23637  ORF Transcript_9671/g.23637 Transcript_9671/m.23637 type:complete len:576 (-) Transcript_9671:93-1820(-)|eukprot:CAMPEP_0181132842 /NCGR_PEP_ID=MMETSP1071-20121207/31214_1 /TAXON_ID=35127 /ORGANISM="Thalassiosira sp., Strain NH16" /LENGTH=575 /DNA_ID=CAMNT_0023219209 /DNA_START=39 /DNA_END=1766 /DNA_ORIENTATION=-